MRRMRADPQCGTAQPQGLAPAAAGPLPPPCILPWQLPLPHHHSTARNQAVQRHILAIEVAAVCYVSRYRSNMENAVRMMLLSQENRYRHMYACKSSDTTGDDDLKTAKVRCVQTWLDTFNSD